MSKEKVVKKSLMNRILDGIEKAGNKLPDPVTLFLLLAVIVVVLSGICSYLGVEAVNPANGKTITVRNLFSADGIRYLWSNVITNFANFAPLSMVLVAVIGSSVAEKSGFLIALMQRFLGKSKGWIVTMAVVFLGINLNIAGDAGFIILPPLAAVLFSSIGRKPIIGLYVAFASVAAGFAGNIALGLADALAYGFTEPAARMLDPNYAESIAINWYFLIVSCLLLTVVGTIVTEKIMVPRLTEIYANEEATETEELKSISDIEKKGLVTAGIAFLGFVALMALLSLPIFGDVAILADAKGSITSGGAPFTKGIVFTVSLALLVPGVAYGAKIGKYKNDKDVWGDISKGFSEMGNYVFMCFFISIFTNFFGSSNLGTILAISGANGLKAIEFTGMPLMIGLVFVSAVVNLFIGSASAKWAILAPVFVPMMMLLGYDPALTQIVYRIGDSITNPLSPLFYYMPVLLGYARKYDKNVGLGTAIANMVPYSTSFAIVWIIQLVVWVMLNIPLGPGGRIFLPM